MYVGRIVAVGRTPLGMTAALYRVSSRSFPNRTVQLAARSAAVVPREGHEADLSKSPYIAYNCIRIEGPYVIASNGSQTDPIAERIAAGAPPKDAIALALLALDYEKDDYKTPRIAAVGHASEDRVWLGVVREDGIEVRAFGVEPGEGFYVATYERSVLSSGHRDAFDFESAEEGARHAIGGGGVFAGLTHPVTAACAVWTREGFALAAAIAP
ncbi:MAG: IMP cyclohydrolase [Planctomycetes bacterium]|nr:IMP cyclohydrolase [Planctomycetota bacterium]